MVDRGVVVQRSGQGHRPSVGPPLDRAVDFGVVDIIDLVNVRNIVSGQVGNADRKRHRIDRVDPRGRSERPVAPVDPVPVGAVVGDNDIVETVLVQIADADPDRVTVEQDRRNGHAADFHEPIADVSEERVSSIVAPGQIDDICRIVRIGYPGLPGHHVGPAVAVKIQHRHPAAERFEEPELSIDRRFGVAVAGDQSDIGGDLRPCQRGEWGLGAGRIGGVVRTPGGGVRARRPHRRPGGGPAFDRQTGQQPAGVKPAGHSRRGDLFVSTDLCQKHRVRCGPDHDRLFPSGGLQRPTDLTEQFREIIRVPHRLRRSAVEPSDQRDRLSQLHPMPLGPSQGRGGDRREGPVGVASVGLVVSVVGCFGLIGCVGLIRGVGRATHRGDQRVPRFQRRRFQSNRPGDQAGRPGVAASSG